VEQLVRINLAIPQKLNYRIYQICIKLNFANTMKQLEASVIKELAVILLMEKMNLEPEMT